MIKFAFLSENKSGHSHIKAEWGLSIYIEAGGKKILFDAGASDVLYRENAELMGIDLAGVDFAMVSHGHYDHTNGFPEFIRVNDHAPIYIHKKAFGEVYGSEDGIMDSWPCSIAWSPEDKKRIQTRIEFTEGPKWITDDIVISGTVPMLPGHVMQEVFYEKMSENNYVKDELEHEQILAIRDRDSKGESKGVYVFAGCCHRGALAALKCAQELFPGEEVKVFVAGMHLCISPLSEIQRVVKEIEDSFSGIVMPVHCSGMPAICYMVTKLGDRCIPATAGDRFEY